ASYPRETQEMVFDAHDRAFALFEGTCRRGIYDVLDNRARPYATREIVLGDELAGRANQNFDDVERATADRDGSSTGPQFTASNIDLPLTRLVQQSSAW
ncbi:MAG TPA: hypothetical protein VJ251_08765, partial [Stellaceae bacterium]|nr:hypothetical protein [Stellaceae bacterium]